MIARLLQFALRQRFVSVLLGLLLIGLGLWAFRQLKVEAYPDISDTQVVVITQYPGRAAEEVEQQVTIPIERALNSTPNVIARRSRTIFGLSVVELTFAFGTNDYFARQVVLEKLRDVPLPPGVASSLGPLSTPIGELYRYSLSSSRLGPMQLRELQDWVIEPRLLQVPGVADVVPFGGLIKQYQIQVDPQALNKYSLTIGQIASAVDANNQNAGGSLLDTQQQSMAIRGVGRITGIEDLENVVVTARNGVPLYVRDIAQIEIGPAPRTGIFGLGEDGDRVQGIVLMRRGENPSEVLRSIKEAVEDLNAQLQPDDVRIEPIYDRTDLVENTLRTVSKTLLEGLAIVVLVLLAFLGSVRAALLTALTIPLSLLFAFVCMHFTGIPANLLSLGALDFGIIVDGTLIMVEHILHRLSHRGLSSGDSVLRTIRDAALEVERPIFFSMTIIIAAYLPLFTLERVERRLFTPMAFTVCYALVGSMLLALTLIPVLSTYFFRSGAKEWENPVLRWVAGRYAGVLTVAARRPVAIVLVAFGVVLGSLAFASRIGSEFLPQLDEGVIWVRANLTPGISLSKSAQVASEIRSVLAGFPEVKLVSSQSGRNDSGTDPYGPNRNEFFVALKPYETWQPWRTKRDLVEDMSIRLRQQFPSAAFSFTQPIVDNVTESVTGSAADLAVILTGPDLDVLREQASKVLALVEQVRGAADTAIEQEAGQAQLRILIQRAAAARYGISVRDIQDVIELALGGQPVSVIFDGERRFDVVVRYLPEARKSPSDIGKVMVTAANGARIPLSQLAEISFPDGASIIARRENRRQVTVRTNIRGRDQGGFVREAQALIDRSVKLPEGYRIEWGGQFENLERARKRLTFILPVTVGIIWILLFFAFGSSAYASLVLMTVPFSLAGGIAALLWRDINLSVSAAVGFISLFGVAVMSGVLVVAEINRRRRDDPAISVASAVVAGAAAQLRPVMMMILVALLGMVPAARATGIGSDVQRPLATVVVGGLLSTLLLTLTALPALYLLLFGRRKTLA
jgi:cobalt-zinc-cadmium resistance protein CzcA